MAVEDTIASAIPANDRDRYFRFAGVLAISTPDGFQETRNRSWQDGLAWWIDRILPTERCEPHANWDARHYDSNRMLIKNEHAAPLTDRM